MSPFQDRNLDASDTSAEGSVHMTVALLLRSLPFYRIATVEIQSSGEVWISEKGRDPLGRWRTVSNVSQDM